MTKKRAITDSCIACGMTPLSRNEIGINKKLIDAGATRFYCLSCLADYLGVSQQDILDKIEEFKEEGCKLFD